MLGLILVLAVAFLAYLLLVTITGSAIAGVLAFIVVLLLAHPVGGYRGLHGRGARGPRR